LVDSITCRRRVFDLAADELSYLVPEIDQPLFAVDLDTEFHIPKVVFEQLCRVVLPQVTDIAGVPLLADAEFKFADSVKSIRIEFGELRLLVAI
jgi:hypothetical protein